jgi:hypothetical protein
LLNNSRGSNQRGRKGVIGVGGLLIDLAAPVAFGLPNIPGPFHRGVEDAGSF